MYWQYWFLCNRRRRCVLGTWFAKMYELEECRNGGILIWFRLDCESLMVNGGVKRHGQLCRNMLNEKLPFKAWSKGNNKIITINIWHLTAEGRNVSERIVEWSCP